MAIPDFNFNQSLSPDSILAALEKKNQTDAALQMQEQQRQAQGWQDVVKASGNFVSAEIQRSKTKQREDFVKTLSDSLADTSALSPNASPGLVNLGGVTTQVPTASFNPQKSDAIRAAVTLNPAKATEAYLKQTFEDPLAQQNKAATLEGKLLTNQQKNAQFGEVPDTVKKALGDQGFNVPDGMTLADLKAAMPGMSAGMRAKALTVMASARGDQVTGQMSEKMGADLNPAKFKNGTPEGAAAQRVFAAKDAKALFEQVRTQPDGPDRRQSLEASIATIRTLVGGSNGQISEKMVNEMVPQSMRGKYANWEEYLKNAPAGNMQQQFMDRLETTIDRVTGINQNVVDDAVRQNLSSYRVLHKRDPEVWNAQVEAAGLDPKDIVGDVYKPDGLRRLRNTSLGKKNVNNTFDLGNGASYEVIH